MHASTSHSLPLLAILAAATLGGCVAPLQDGFEDSFSEKGGCGDVEFYAVDEADEVMLTLIVNGLIDEAQEAGEEITTEFELPSDEVTLIVEQGQKISDATCDDVIVNGGPQVHRTHTAISGKVQITARPSEDLDDTNASADLQLQDVVFESESSGDTSTLKSLSIEDVQVGWLAG